MTSTVDGTVDGTATGYWHDAIYDPLGTLLDGVEDRNVKEGDPGEPLRHKTYPGLPRRALPPPALTLCTPPAGAWLGTFLYYSYGVHRHDPEPGSWPYHRLVPSARCFFPTEFYLALAPGRDDGDEGVHYYDPMHHTLVRLRDGDHRGVLADATGADLSGAAAVVVLSALFWKTAFRYRDYAYRLCAQEAGLVAGNVLLVAEALGMSAHVHFLFRDRSVHRLLGLREPAENAFAVVALYPCDASGRGRPLRPAPAGAGDAAEALPDLRTVHGEPSGYDADAVPVLTRVSRAALMPTAASPVGGVGIRPARPPATTPVLTAPVDPPAGTDADLAGALRARDSGPGYLAFRPADVPAEAVWRIVRDVTRPYPCDVAAPSGEPVTDCHLVVRSATGIAAGVYRVTSGVALEAHRIGPVDEVLHDIALADFTMSTVDFAGAPLTAFVSVPRRAADVLGARGFRILSQAAGIAAQRICVASAYSGLVARVHNGYSAVAAERWLGLADGDTVLFQIAIGAARPAPALKLPVVF